PGNPMPQPLPIPVRVLSGDFVQPKDRQGSREVLEDSRAKGHVKTGDRLFGVATVVCSNCITERSYWLYFKVGTGGRYSEMIGSVRGREISLPPGSPPADDEILKHL